MKDKSFKANDWLINPKGPNRNKALGSSELTGAEGSVPPPVPSHAQSHSFSNAALKIKSEPNESFEPTQFLVPEWKGDGLITPEAVVIQKVVDRLWIDAQNQFQKFCDQTKSLKLLVFSEFQNYAKERRLEVDAITGPSEFWSHFANSESPFYEELAGFRDIYCFRAVSIYLLKVRFILNLADVTDSVLTPNNLISPGAYLAQIFRKNSSTELISEALQSNHYSWYRPSLQSQYLIENAAQALSGLSLTELMKVLTYRNRQIREKLCFEDEHFSHSLSHRSFGRFLIDTLIFLPRWLDNSLKRARPLGQGRPDVLCTKFVGGQLSSLSLSHWLAQEDYLNIPWDCVIAPDFIGSEKFSSGQYIKICHELQFITFLLQVAKRQGFEPISFLCQTMRSKSTYGRSNSSGQMSLLGAMEHASAGSTYQRIFIHLNNLPKNNSHHYLMTQINGELASLLPDGRLYVLTNQKLFVPSLSEKTDQLLKNLKLEAFFNFEELKHKGEVAPYLYVFKKRTSEEQSRVQDPFSPVKKELFCNFNISGELNQFSQFAKLARSLSRFFDERFPHNTPYYQSENEGAPTFEFYQDAIVDGKLVSSLPRHEGQVTHPTYFKNLTKTCVPFDTFFYVESLGASDKKSRPLTTELLGLNSSNEERFPLILIVDFSRNHDLRLELIFRESYAAKRDAYGSAYFQYFGLIPKVEGLNVDIIRTYFNSVLGRQITGLSLDGGLTKLKSKVKAMLVPKAFGGNSFWEGSEPVPELQVMNLSVDELCALSPLELSKRFYHDAEALRANFSRGQLVALKSVMDFAHRLQKSMERLGLSAGEGQAATIYQNSFVKERLVKLPTYSLCPHHDDVYVQVLIDAPRALELPLESVELKKDSVEVNESFTLTLKASNMPIICLHGPQNLLDFTSFILSRAKGVPLQRLLGQLRLPTERMLTNALTDFFELQREYRKVTDQSTLLLKELMGALVTAPTSRS